MALPEREPSAAVSRVCRIPTYGVEPPGCMVVRGAATCHCTLCIPVAGVTLRSSRLRAGLKTKLAACRSGYVRSIVPGPRPARPPGPRPAGSDGDGATGSPRRGGAGERRYARATAGAAVRGRRRALRACAGMCRVGLRNHISPSVPTQSQTESASQSHRARSEHRSVSL